MLSSKYWKEEHSNHVLNHNMMENIIVTGGFGFIGLNLMSF